MSAKSDHLVGKWRAGVNGRRPKWGFRGVLAAAFLAASATGAEYQIYRGDEHVHTGLPDGKGSVSDDLFSAKDPACSRPDALAAVVRRHGWLIHNNHPDDVNGDGREQFDYDTANSEVIFVDESFSGSSCYCARVAQADADEDGKPSCAWSRPIWVSSKLPTKH